jgi:membrane-bound lytic murein transglycosylase D
VPSPLLAALLWGTALGQVPAPPPQAPAVAQVVPAVDSDSTRILRLQALVEAAEHALEADDEDAAADRADEADVLTADWPLELLKLPEVQALLQRLKDVQDQVGVEEAAETEPGLKAPEEVVTLSGDELRAEQERVKAAEKGATYDYPIDLNDRVLTWVSLFTTTKRGFMENALGRASMYMPMIRQVFAEEGVPADLAYLAVIESGFRNEANSKAKAVGMWQFIRSTGRIYGLNGNAWLEERRDPIKATRAAARYLKRLYQISGDWYLAASSYNAGPLTLDRAIQNVGSRNFWDLARSRWLRTETKNYIPELCAAILVGRNPERYGLRIVPLTPYSYETVAVTSMTSLTVLARCADTDAATLKALNPELLRGSTPPGSYLLRVPPGRAMDCLRQLARMPANKRLDFQNYTVRKGDTLAKVAKRFKVTEEDLLVANDLTAKQFKPGKRLLVPPAPSLALDDRDLAAKSTKPKSLGDQPLPPLPVVPRELAPGDEGEKPAPESRPVTPARELPVPAPASAVPVRERTPAVEPPAATRKPEPAAPKAKAQAEAPATVRAKPGDTLSKLARTYDLSLSELLRLNPEAAKALHPGDEIRLSGGAASAKVAPARTKAAPAPPAAAHRVVKGETLAAIARRYDVELSDLRTWNHLKGDRIQVGQKLRVAP